MSNTPFAVLTGNCRIGASSGTAVDVKDAVIALKLYAKRTVIQVPATFATGTMTPRLGGASYELEIDFLPDDTDTASLFSMLWDATDPTDNPTGELYFEGNLHEDAATSADNPKWSGTFLVSDVALGGASNTVARHSAKFPVPTRPDKAIA